MKIAGKIADWVYRRFLQADVCSLVAAEVHSEVQRRLAPSDEWRLGILPDSEVSNFWSLAQKAGVREVIAEQVRTTIEAFIEQTAEEMLRGDVERWVEEYIEGRPIRIDLRDGKVTMSFDGPRQRELDTLR